MDRIEIEGGVSLRGRVRIAGAKNACLAMLPAALLTGEPVTLRGVPELADVAAMAALLRSLGAAVEELPLERRISVDASRLTSRRAPYDIVRKMRASFLVLGPLLAREGAAEVSQPGGCAIGERSIELHLEAIRALGAEVELVDGYVCARAPRGLRGAQIVFSYPSVGATENAMMAAAVARGETEIVNAAREPEIVALADMLRAMGAEVEGAGKPVVRISGVPGLQGADSDVIPDRIEFGTYVGAAVITDGDLVIEAGTMDGSGEALRLFREAGADIQPVVGGVRVRRSSAGIRPVFVQTGPYPGFPTDLQAQLMAVLTLADGESVVEETVFEHRFMHVPELGRMGANISVGGGRAVVRGVTELRGAPVMATDLRASASLILAGLAAKGATIVNRVYHLDRGYERPVGKLSACGARIRRVAE